MADQLQCCINDKTRHANNKPFARQNTHVQGTDMKQLTTSSPKAIRLSGRLIPSTVDNTVLYTCSLLLSSAYSVTAWRAVCVQRNNCNKLLMFVHSISP